MVFCCLGMVGVPRVILSLILAMSAATSISVATAAAGNAFRLLLSRRFLGFYMVPDGGLWNYNWMGVKHSPNMKYTVTLDNPKEFYNSMFRPAHFLKFATLDSKITPNQLLPILFLVEIVS